MRHALLVLALAGLYAGEATPPVAPAPTTQPANKAYLGVAIDPAATAFEGKGLAILRVEPGSPAAVMGLAAGDRLISIDGKSLKNQDELAAAIYGKKAGDTVQIEAARAQGKDGLPQTLQLSGVLQETPRSRVGSLGSQLAELQGRISELNAKSKEPTLAEVLQKLQDIETDLPKAAEAFKNVYPNGEFRITISVEITSDKTAKDPLDIDVTGKPETDKPVAKPTETKPEAAPVQPKP
jgi:membrane-associated protease RseP (regulator of RpoE activity)